MGQEITIKMKSKPESKMNNIELWAKDLIKGVGGFKSYEKYECAVFPNRDIAIVEFTIRALANPDCKGSKEVVEAILKQRQK